MIGRQLGPYRILSKIGEGGMATVWTARHDLLGRDVALKILKRSLAGDAHARKRFLAEARWASALDHPNIAAVLDAGLEGDDSYIAFTLVQGDTISALAERSPLSIREVVQMGIGIGDALAEVHAHGLVHRDVTGRNIMKNLDGRFMLLDFGLALSDRSTRLTSSGVIMGTAAYLSPEVVNQQRAEATSDIWGLGVVMFEALTGRLPFAGHEETAVLYAILNAPIPRPASVRPGVPETLDAIVLKALEREKGRRYARAEDLVEALHNVVVAPATGADAGAPAGSSAAVSHGARPVLGGGESGVAPPPLPEYGRRFVAVLPFLAPDAADQARSPTDHFSRSLAEALAAGLTEDGDLQIIPPSAAPADFASHDDLALAARLRANLLLRGELRQQGMQLRFTWSLIDPARGLTRSAGTVEGSMAHPFDFEDEIVHRIREALGLGRPPGARVYRATSDSVAHERYLKALGYLQREENEAMVDGAVSLLEDLASADSASAQVHSALGRAYLSKYRLTFEPRWEKRAIQSCLHAMTLDPEAADVLVTLGEVHLSAGRWSEAVHDFERALTVQPKASDAHIGLGLAFEALGRLPDAEHVLRTAIDLRPDDWVAHNRLGALLTRHGRYAEAVDVWKRVLELTPDNARAYSNLGGTYVHLDDLESALPLFRKSVNIQPSATAYSNLATTLYLLAGETPGTERAKALFMEAADLLERACALRPADARLWGYLGSVCRFVEGREQTHRTALERAVSLMRERLDRNPDDAYDWGQLAGWLVILKRSHEAEEAISRGLAIAPHDVQMLCKAGTVYYNLGRRRESLDHLRQALAAGHTLVKLLRDPYLKELREDEAFRRIMDETAAARRR